MNLTNSIFEKGDYEDVSKLTLVFKGLNYNYSDAIEFHYAQEAKEVVRLLRVMANHIEQKETYVLGRD
jgi:hypothetical protein